MEEEWLLPFQLQLETPSSPSKPRSQKQDVASRHPPHKCLGHFCEQSLLVPLTSLDPIQRPYQFTVRYNLEPLKPQLVGRTPYIVALAADKLRQLGKGAGVDVLDARKSWLARDCRCSPLMPLGNKLVGEICITLDAHGLFGPQMVLLTVVGIRDMTNQQDWLTFGEPSVLHVIFPAAPVPDRRREACVQAGTSDFSTQEVQATVDVSNSLAQTWETPKVEMDTQTQKALISDTDVQTDAPLVQDSGMQAGCLLLVDTAAQASRAATVDHAVNAVATQAEESSQTPVQTMVHASTLTLQPQLCHAGVETCPSVEDALTQTVESGEPQSPIGPECHEMSTQVDRRDFDVEVSTQMECSDAEDPPAASRIDSSVGDLPIAVEPLPQLRTDASTQSDNTDCLTIGGQGSMEASSETCNEPRLVDGSTQVDIGLVDGSTQVDIGLVDGSTQVDIADVCTDELSQQVEASTQVEEGDGDTSCHLGSAASAARAPALATSRAPAPKVVVDEETGVAAGCKTELSSTCAESEPLLEAETNGPKCTRRIGTQTVVQGFVPNGSPKLRLMKLKPPQATPIMWQCLALGLISGFLLGMGVSLAISPGSGSGLLVV